VARQPPSTGEQRYRDEDHDQRDAQRSALPRERDRCACQARDTPQRAWEAKSQGRRSAQQATRGRRGEGAIHLRGCSTSSPEPLPPEYVLRSDGGGAIIQTLVRRLMSSFFRGPGNRAPSCIMRPGGHRACRPPGLSATCYFANRSMTSTATSSAVASTSTASDIPSPPFSGPIGPRIGGNPSPGMTSTTRLLSA
jgi:hypothetical protein